MDVVGGWPDSTCSSIGLRTRFERFLSPDHARSSLHLVRAIDGTRRYVRKVHGSTRSYDIETAFYQRVRHPLISAAVCWEPFMERGGGDGSSSSSSNSGASSSSNNFFSFLDADPEMAKAATAHHPSDRALIIDFVPGGQSGDWMYELGLRTDQETGLSTIRRLTGQLVDAVQYVHAAGMVHGDIKPENVLIQYEALPDSSITAAAADIRLIDFDLSASVTSPRLRAGTRSTMSPEVAVVVSGPVHEGSDWWSVGATVLLWATAWRCGQLERTGARGGSRVCSYRPFQFVRAEGRIDIRPLPEAMELPSDLARFLWLLLDPNPANRRFVSINDLSFLRDSFGLKTERYQYKRSSSGSSTGSRWSHGGSSSSMHSVSSDEQQKTSQGMPSWSFRCDSEECIKEPREPFFGRLVHAQ